MSRLRYLWGRLFGFVVHDPATCNSNWAAPTCGCPVVRLPKMPRAAAQRAGGGGT